MRIVAIEEHFLVPSLVDEHFDAKANPGFTPERHRQLADLGDGRLRDMDDHGISQQVISATMPGADLLDGQAGISFARRTNDALALSLRSNPGRFGGFAHLPMRSPDAAADELERAVVELGFSGAMVNGMTENQFLDHPRFKPILARAESLDVPIYIHPNLPPKEVFDIYYGGLPGNTGARLAAGVFGWHSETAIHVLRLAMSGTFEEFPKLNVVVGHMGEMLPFILGRADQLLSTGPLKSLSKPISHTIVDHVYITTSGFFTIPPFLSALTTFGADRILFSVDYPYSNNEQGRRFFDILPVSHTDRIKIAHGNADRLLKLRPAS